MTWGLRRALPELAGWLLALGATLSSSACGVDDRSVGVFELQPDAAAEREPCGPECPEVLCPGDDACRDYPDALPRGTCSPGGASCASVADCAYAWKPEARDGQACACDDAGCKLLPGEACTRSDVCQSGTCIATDAGGNVCCAAQCADDEVCAPDGSICVTATPCVDEQRRCSGASYEQCVAGAWQAITDCAELGCKIEQGGCLRSAGQACESDADCGQGSCLATAEGSRVCCTAACDTSCRRCGASGTSCDEIADDEACGVIECPSDPCRTYTPSSVTTNRCVAGQCATPAEACTAFEPARPDLECSPSALCDDAGNCSRPKKDLLASCGGGAECESGACVATLGGSSVCCAEPCGANELCGASGSCVLAPVCENGTTQCSGSNFQRCTDGQWRNVRECGSLGCNVARGGCFAAAGDTCGSDADCGAGTCQPTSSGSNVCCTAACDGPCRRCAPSGIACENLADDAECGTIACPQGTTCRSFPASVSTNRCDNGRCGSAAQLCVGTPRNSGQSCSATNLCDGAGNCQLPKKALGVACQNGSECAQGNCVDGVCCSAPCSGTCFTCAGTNGICSAPAADSRCSTGACASPGVCQPPSVLCGTVSCPITGAVCCSELNAAFETRLTCVRGTETCPPPSANIPAVPINCDQNVDCPANRVCCMAGTSTSSEVSCKLPGPSNGTDETSLDFESCNPRNPMLFGNQLCRSPQGTFACPAFENCEFTTDRLPGYTFCR